MSAKFSEIEIKFLKNREESRVATSHNDIIHIKPVSYIFYNSTMYVATDYNTRFLKNLKINPKIAIVVDIYKHGGHKAICIQADAEIIENGQEFLEIFDVFLKKFEWVRNDPWKENEAPFIKIVPFHVTSWGLK